MLALEGIKVLDLSGLAPGAFCTMILGDLGAEIIKIESPTVSPLVGGGPSFKGEENRKAAAHVALNRNKRSLALNLKSGAGREVFYRLARQADVIIEGYRPGVARRLGIDYKTIGELNQEVIYCSLSGYGQDGPYSNLPGHDINYISLAGVLGLIGPADGPPVIPLNLAADFAAAPLYAAIAILTALIARNKTGKGQYLDIAYIDGLISMMTYFTYPYFFHDLVPRRGESFTQGAFPYYGIYETKDGKYITIACTEIHFWERLLRLLGKEEYIPYHFHPEHRFRKTQDKKWEEICSELEKSFLTKTRDEWFELLSQNDIPAGKVQSMDEVFADPQVLHRHMVIEIEHPALGKIKQVGIAPRLSDTPGKVRSLAPLLGEHSQQILQEVGYTQEEIEHLRQEGAVVFHEPPKTKSS